MPGKTRKQDAVSAHIASSIRLLNYSKTVESASLIPKKRRFTWFQRSAVAAPNSPSCATACAHGRDGIARRTPLRSPKRSSARSTHRYPIRRPPDRCPECPRVVFVAAPPTAAADRDAGPPANPRSHEPHKAPAPVVSKNSIPAVFQRSVTLLHSDRLARRPQFPSLESR